MIDSAHNLARTTGVPLLVNLVERAADKPDIRREHPFCRIPFATDFPSTPTAAFDASSYLQHTIKKAAPIHVWSSKNDNSDGDVSPTEPLTEQAGTLEGCGIETQTEVRRGNPAEQILSVKAGTTPSAVLVGAKGWSRIRRLLLGNVSEEIGGRATGDVFLIPAPRTI